jgi:hypothetical protein
MKRNFSCLLALSALILMGGCKKSLNSSSSVDLSTGAKAGFAVNALWQHPTLTGRVIRFDIGDGNGSDCLFTYDVGSGNVSLTKVNGSTSTTIYSGSGIPTANSTPFDVRQGSAVTDYYNEVGGVHIIPYDANGTGHEDHLLIYIPGTGYAEVLSYLGNGSWYETYQSGSGIGGYNLTSPYDKIIAYDYGSGYKNALICYRPGYGNIWVLKQTGTTSIPAFTAVVEGSGGIAGYDLKGPTDQLVAIGGNAGAMNLVAYRPSVGYVWYISHVANSTVFNDAYNSRSGLFNFNFADKQDRLIAWNDNGNPTEVGDNSMYCYRPYPQGYPTVDDAESQGTITGGAPDPGLNYTFPNNPYGSSPTYIGDHVLAFSPNAQGNSSVLFYSNGGTNQSQIYEFNTQTSNYTQVY